MNPRVRTSLGIIWNSALFSLFNVNYSYSCLLWVFFMNIYVKRCRVLQGYISRTRLWFGDSNFETFSRKILKKITDISDFHVKVLFKSREYTLCIIQQLQSFKQRRSLVNNPSKLEHNFILKIFMKALGLFNKVTSILKMGLVILEWLNFK